MKVDTNSWHYALIKRWFTYTPYSKCEYWAKVLLLTIFSTFALAGYIVILFGMIAYIPLIIYKVWMEGMSMMILVYLSPIIGGIIYYIGTKISCKPVEYV